MNNKSYNLAKKKFESLAILGAILALVAITAMPSTVLAQANPTRDLPDEAVQRGETFDVTITFIAPHGDFHAIGLTDLVPSGWAIEVDRAWCEPDADEFVVTDNKVELMWFGPGTGYPAGTTFTAVYKVTVPNDASVGEHTFANGTLEYHYGATGHEIENIGGDSQVEVPKPGEAWVDDDWEGYSPGDPADGHIFGYDAFATIQEGIDGVADSTVHVLEGTYDGFIVESRENLSIIGEEDDVEVTVANNFTEGGSEYWVMAFVANSTAINIEGLDFDGSDYASKETVEGIAYGNSTGSISDVTVSDIVGTEIGIGIGVWGGEIDTVDISDSTVQGCNIGVIVWNDQANLSDCTITGSGPHSIGIMAVNGAIVNIESCDISDCWVESPTEENAGIGIMIGMPEEYEETFGIVDEALSTVEITGCSKILHNNHGIYVDDDGDLVANGNNIAGNDIYGIYNNATGEVDAENNWWGDENGPTHEDNPLTTTGDEVVGNVDYIPWLDAPCPGGEPAGPVAGFVGEPRTGTAPLDVQFTDESTGTFDIVSWAWDFGDGTTSEEQNPTHTYTDPGSYDVSLTVTDEIGLSDTETKSAYIHVVKKAAMVAKVAKPAKFVASYLRISPNQVLPGQEVKISLNIANHGEERGSDTVALYINSQLEQSQTVGVSPGCCQDVVFRVTKSTPGTYQVSVKGQQGQFTVLAPAATGFFAGGLGAGGIIAIVVFVIALILGLVLILRRE